MFERSGNIATGYSDEMSNVNLLPERYVVINRVLANHPSLPRTSYSGFINEDVPVNPLTSSKFGGETPFLPKDKSWPSCVDCSTSKAFICQINLADIPQGVQEYIGLSSGLFQLFFCFECSPFEDVFDDIYILPQHKLDVPSLKLLAGAASTKLDLEAACVPGSVMKFIREIKNVQQTEGKQSKGYFTPRKYPEHFVTWTENSSKELMNCEELQQFLEDRNEWNLTATEVDAVYDFFDNMDEDLPICSPISGIKLGGYIVWIQGVEYPTCTTCNITMDTTFLQERESTRH